MIQMSEMKNVLGDMDFEEFLASRKLVLEKVKGVDLNEFLNISCDTVDKFYDYWLDIGGRCIAEARMHNHYNGRIVVDQVDEFAQYLLSRFVDWLENFD
jgi:hypothetical protein